MIKVHWSNATFHDLMTDFKETIQQLNDSSIITDDNRKLSIRLKFMS